jgi:hypothetical protein
MSIDAVAFAFGAILLLIGILGGGFELRELKIPTVSKPIRLISVIVGVFMLMVGIGIHPDSSSDVLLPEPIDAQNVTPPPVDPELGLLAAIRYADDVTIRARYDLDPDSLSQAYTGEALRAELAAVQSLRSRNLYEDASLDDQEVQFVKVAPDGGSAEVRLIETWSTVYYSVSDHKCVSRSQGYKTPQTIQLQRTDRGWMVSAVLFDLRAAKDQLVTCA